MSFFLIKTYKDPTKGGGFKKEGHPQLDLLHPQQAEKK